MGGTQKQSNNYFVTQDVFFFYAWSQMGWGPAQRDDSHRWYFSRKKRRQRLKFPKFVTRTQRQTNSSVFCNSLVMRPRFFWCHREAIMTRPCVGCLPNVGPTQVWTATARLQSADFFLKPLFKRHPNVTPSLDLHSNILITRATHCLMKR